MTSVRSQPLPDFVRDHDIDPITLDIIENTLSNTRYEMDRADALVGAGQKDAARTILKALAARFPTAKRIQDKLDKIK